MNILIARICRGSCERCEVGTFCAAAAVQGLQNSHSVLIGQVDQEPTPAARNKAARWCIDQGFDVLFMLDADQAPNPDFFTAAVEFLGQYPAAVIGSPYCGAPPERRVHVQSWAAIGTSISRPEAAWKHGIERVGCAGTGVIAIGVQAFSLLRPPYFDYEYATPAHEDAITTEDFYFTRNLTAAGGSVYVDWDHWSIHFKPEAIGHPSDRPIPGLTAAGVPQRGT